jgi:methyl-accepting chemotaxis protein
MGIAGVDRSLTQVLESVKKFKPYSTAGLFLISPAGKILSITGEFADVLSAGDRMSDNEFFGKIYSKSKGRKGIFEIENPHEEEDIDYLVLAPLPLSGMMLILSVEKEEIVAPIFAAIYRVGIIGGVAFIALVLTIALVSRFIVVRPVRNIMNLFFEIGMGNFDARAKVFSGDELGEMAVSLNAMLDNTLALIQSREERDAIQAAVMKLLTEISDLADGDLTIRADVTAEITGAIADSFNAMAEQLGW